MDGARLVQIVRSTISGNANTQGDFAAALWASEAAVVMRASTVSGNEGNGVLFVVGAGPDEARLDVEGSTIAGNTGAGLSCLYGACGPVATTILDGNGQDCAGTVRSGGFNLVASPVGCTLLPGRNADLVGFDARLAPLGDNGGFTRTHALLPGSPATAAITDGNWCTRADQRGVRRRRPCDVGAYEAP
ncbi:hypothetical protein K2Z84_14260 [Candidatus Binatia bacterium]|nr:hypothetical protein [Candidatus Binatia bacterium]